MLLQKPGAQFPAASLGRSQQLVTPALGDPLTSSGTADTSVHVCVCAHTQRDTDIIKCVCVFNS